MPARAHFGHRGFGGNYSPAPTAPVPLFRGLCMNDYLINKTSGPGGDYPTGDVGLYGGVYYWNPIDLTPGAGYARPFDPTKPNNNYLRIYEYDGPGTVTWDLRPESAASALGQTQTQAYNDLNHGGGIRNVDGTAGDVRWIFDGKFLAQDGGIHFTNQMFVNASTTNGNNILRSSPGAFKSWWVGWKLSGGGVRGSSTIVSVSSDGSSVQMSLTAFADSAFVTVVVESPGVNNIIWRGVRRRFKITEWRRQYNIIAALSPHNMNTVGVSLPDDYVGTGPYTQVWFDARFKGNTFTNGWRLEGANKHRVIAADAGPLGDDAMFTGGCSNVDVIGSVFHEFDNTYDSYGGVSAAQGPLVTTRMHNDGWQNTGPSDNCRWLDSTAQGHAFELVAEQGTITNMVVDRVWTGVGGAAGGDIGSVNGYTMGSSNKIGWGGPVGPTQIPSPPSATANPSASSAAKAVLGYLTGMPARSTRKLLSGQFQGFNPSNPNEAVAFAAINQIHTNTGKWVGLVGGDYAFNGGNFTPVNNLLIGYWNAGSLVTLSYHMPNPVTGGDAFDTSVVNLASMLTPGNAQRTAWLAELDATAVGLAALRDAGVVVLWRPFHEMNDPWFWWGNRDTTLFKALWVDMFNYFTTTKGLNNLLWVYGAGGGDDNSADYYPGSAYVDVVGGDHYADLNGSSPNILGLDRLAALGKPMTLTEFGPSPTDTTYNWPDILAYIKARYPQLAYILVWGGSYGMDRSLYTNASAFLNDTWMANRDTGWAAASSHFVKTFGNGYQHVDGEAQQGYAVAGGGANYHTGLTSNGDARYSASVLNVSVQVPAGVTVDANGFMTSPLTSFLSSTDAPHKVFDVAYGAASVFTILADYGILLD